MNAQRGDIMAQKLRIGGLFLFTFSLLFFSCASTPIVEEKKIPVTYCMVYDYDSKPVPDVEIYVNGVIQAKTDINGRCMIVGFNPGSYEVLFTKQDYESLKNTVALGDIGQVLYIKIISCAQLLSKAEKELDQRHWQETRAFIDRVLAIHPTHPAARYLDAVLHFRQNDAEGAEKILFSLLKDDYHEPYILLFLADLEQYRLGNLEKAKAQLVDYLKLRYDPDIEQRLQALIQEMESSQSKKYESLNPNS
jgi:hypothetical protein